MRETLALSSASEPSYELEWRADVLERDVVNELAVDVFTDVSGLLETILPVPGVLVDTVLTAASKGGRYYDLSSKLWKCYPSGPPTHEEELYASFVTLAQSIADCIPAAEKNDVQWRDYHGQKPLSRSCNAPDIRPDIVATVGVSPEEAVPWSRIVISVKVKKHVSKGPALLQLLKSMRMLFRESVDRCFAVGMVIACTNMAVYLADRTGVLGSVVFDIHKEPELFVRIIVGICTASPARLGWDTSMSVIHEQKAYSEDDLRAWSPEPSYAIPFDFRNEQYWVIDMPKPKDDAEFGIMDEVEAERFVLYKGVNLQRGEVIRGRATRVWKAWVWEDLILPQEKRKIFIVKDSWRDDERRPEGDLYKHIGSTPAVAIMRSYGAVYVDGEEDNTLTRIRRGLHVCAKPRCIHMSQKTVHGLHNDYLPVIDVPERSPLGRTHSRIILESYACPVKMVLAPLELQLVQAMSMVDALAGHWEAFKRGVLHQDFSDGDILITGDTTEGRREITVDFDYAKILGDATLDDDSVTGTRLFMSGEILGGEHYFDDEDEEDGDNLDNTEIEFGDVDDVDSEDGKYEAVVARFYHDLESLFWVLLWVCFCMAGPAMRREELWFIQFAENQAASEYAYIFGDAGNFTVARRKELLIRNKIRFRLSLSCISSWCCPLRPLLRDLWLILNNGYRTRDFTCEDTYQAFMDSFREMERKLVCTPEQRTAYEAEVIRRDADRKDQERAPKKLPKQPKQPEVDEDAQLHAEPESRVPIADVGNDMGEEHNPSPALDPQDSSAILDLGALSLVPGPTPARHEQASETTGIVTRSMGPNAEDDRRADADQVSDARNDQS